LRLVQIESETKGVRPDGTAQSAVAELLISLLCYKSTFEIPALRTRILIYILR
jgi:hypothetical protein